MTRISTIRISWRSAARSCPVEIGSRTMPGIARAVARAMPASRYAIVTDATAGRLYGSRLRRALAAAGKRAVLIAVPDGERSKTREWKAFVEDALFRKGFDRGSGIVALGGGVVGDLAGFVAATYMRGIPYVQVPTTLLAMVDSAIGGKTGVDCPYGKNLIGIFWQPRAVLVHLPFLRTLPPPQLRNGLVEAGKAFLVADQRSFAFFMGHLSDALRGEPRTVGEIVRRAIAVKARVVGGDEREGGERAILNFGHTIGHAVERASRWRVPHGEAVAMGMVVESRISRRLGLLPEEDLSKVEHMVDAMGFSLAPLRRFDPAALVRLTRSDKKSSGGRARYALLGRVGKAFCAGGSWTHAVPEKVAVAAVRDRSIH